MIEPMLRVTAVIDGQPLDITDQLVRVAIHEKYYFAQALDGQQVLDDVQQAVEFTIRAPLDYLAITRFLLYRAAGDRLVVAARMVESAHSIDLGSGAAFGLQYQLKGYVIYEH